MGESVTIQPISPSLESGGDMILSQVPLTQRRAPMWTLRILCELGMVLRAVPARGRWRKEDVNFKASLGYRENSRLACAIQILPKPNKSNQKPNKQNKRQECINHFCIWLSVVLQAAVCTPVSSCREIEKANIQRHL